MKLISVEVISVFINIDERRHYIQIITSICNSSSKKHFFAVMGAVPDLLVFIPGLTRFNEVKSLNVMLRIRSIIKNAFFANL